MIMKHFATDKSDENLKRVYDGAPVLDCLKDRPGKRSRCLSWGLRSTYRSTDNKASSKLICFLKNRNLCGFTLVEILLTVTLFSMCSLAIYKVFSSGIKLWARAQHFAIEEDLSIFLDKFSEDLRNSFYYTGIHFNGTESRLSIPTFVLTPADERSLQVSEELITQIGAVKYYLDFETHTIHRAQANYAQALDGHYPDDRILVSSVNSLRFVYYMPGAKGVAPYSKTNEVIPTAIYVEIKYSDERSEHVLGRIISVPAGV